MPRACFEFCVGVFVVSSAVHGYQHLMEGVGTQGHFRQAKAFLQGRENCKPYSQKWRLSLNRFRLV